MNASTEATPLLATTTGSQKDTHSWKPWKLSVVSRILLCGFLTSLSFAYTQVPMLYAFRLMSCEEYYKTHSLSTLDGSRCSIHAIEADTAKQVAILSTSTTVVGVMNLLLTGWEIKRFGVRFAMVQQTFWPSVRLCWQAIGVSTGGKAGIVLVQTSQLTCFLGGPAGYMLVLNSFVSELITPVHRTAVFGKLQGCIMFGTACGYLVGGVIGDIFGIRSPWDVAFFSMVLATFYSRLFLPYVAPSGQINEPNQQHLEGKKSIRLLGPLRVFEPQCWESPDGRVQKYYNVLFLVSGTFAGVLATGYIPTLLQMYSTIAFAFGTLENGFVMAFFCAMRGVFLTLIFPRIISHGRKWFTSPSAEVRCAKNSMQSVEAQTEAENVEAAVAMGIQDEEEPAAAISETTSLRHSEFDLLFLKWSLVLDGFLTGMATFSWKSWHIVFIAGLLPIASGSAPAAKSVLIEMCPASQKADALNAISLVDMIAKLSTGKFAAS